MEKITINAEGMVVGRLATHAAKQALLGKTVNIVNAEKAIFTGDPVKVKARYLYLRNETGQPMKGPFIYRKSDKFLRRVIKGMLPKYRRGPEAYKQIKCYIGQPEEFKEAITLPQKPKTTKTITVGEICTWMGGKA